MKIVDTQFNVFYPKIPEIRKQMFILEEKLNKQFKTPFNLVPVPDDAPVEIPRIVAMSMHGHSQLHFSLNNAGLTTSYDQEYNSDWGKCRNYIEKKSENYISVIEELSNNRFLFSGLVVRVEIPTKIEPLELLKEKFFKLGSSTNPFDIEFKITFVKDETYYINMTFSNFRFFEGASTVELSSPAYLNLREKGIGVILDINDRFGFNYNKGYSSNRDKQKVLLELATTVLEDKLEEILEKGEFAI